MKKGIFVFIIQLFVLVGYGQNVGIVRKNYYSTYFDSSTNSSYEVFDSATIRLGTINPTTGFVSNLSNQAYQLPINLNSATIDPYHGFYYIGSANQLLTFDINSGNLIHNVPVTGISSSSLFQNFRFNTSDSIIYGMVPINYYSNYFDSSTMSSYQVLDSSRIRFGSIDPVSGLYTIIGNTSFNNIYTLAGNSIDPYQMVYYYSAVDTLIGIDLYNGTLYSAVPIQLPPHGIFENIAYSCVDTSIYGLTRQNYTSIVFDSLLMDYTEVVDSVTFRLSKIDPNTGIVTFISPFNIQSGGNLTGGAYIDPNSMTYYFNHGNKIIGVSLLTGLITTNVRKRYPSGEISIDMMRSSQNCYGSSTLRLKPKSGIKKDNFTNELRLYPNPAHAQLTIENVASIKSISLIDLMGNTVLTTTENTFNIENVPNGIYFVYVQTKSESIHTAKFIKN
jgi:hypothetical protein